MKIRSLRSVRSQLRPNKRVVLGSMTWSIGAVGALNPASAPAATPLVAAGVYITLEPSFASKLTSRITVSPS
ncbi:hypothetical protein [Halorussus halophilus]|uniref:hypothetical protein n=1 Tax=Halorussus halophilus TaxID=2650975 RepID=UPI001301145F|nr:hypothetical protein [Halorussus halophilus]